VSANWKNVDGRPDGRWENSRGRYYKEEGEWKKQIVKSREKAPQERNKEKKGSRRGVEECSLAGFDNV
jgi:hypothetical protein